MLVKIEVYNDGDLWCARGIGEDIFTQGQTVDELYAKYQGSCGATLRKWLKIDWLR